MVKRKLRTWTTSRARRPGNRGHLGTVSQSLGSMETSETSEPRKLGNFGTSEPRTHRNLGNIRTSETSEHHYPRNSKISDPWKFQNLRTVQSSDLSTPSPSATPDTCLLPTSPTSNLTPLSYLCLSLNHLTSLDKAPHTPVSPTTNKDV